ncbi:MAG: hypothetical protein AB1411_01150 [Nitrospirota bacterium]
MKPVTTVAVAVFALVSLTHLLRLILGWEVVVAGKVIPMWASVLGAILPGALAYLLWHESH